MITVLEKIDLGLINEVNFDFPSQDWTLSFLINSKLVYSNKEVRKVVTSGLFRKKVLNNLIVILMMQGYCKVRKTRLKRTLFIRKFVDNQHRK